MVRGLVEVELGDAEDDALAALVGSGELRCSEPKKSCLRTLLSAVLGIGSEARTMHVARNRSSRHKARRVST